MATLFSNLLINKKEQKGHRYLNNCRAYPCDSKKAQEAKMREVAAKSREIQDYYSAMTVKSSGDISANPLQTTAHGPNPALEAV